jgi:hypothetical protein
MNRTSRYVSYLSAIASIALLGYLLRRAGVSTVIQAIRLLGAAFLVLLLLSGIRHGLRAIAWRFCVDPGARPQRFWDLFTLRLMGESVTDLSPAGPFLGESVKIWGVSKSISATFGVTSVVIEDLLYSLGTALFVFVGFFILLVSTARKYRLGKVSGVILLLALASIVVTIIVRQRQLVGKLSLRIRNTARGQALTARYGQVVRSWETGIRGFFKTRRKLLLAVLSIEIAVNLISLAETYLILRGTLAHSSYLDAYLVESANRCAQLVASFVPFGLGVDEGTTTATLHSIGRSISEGVSVAAIRKLRSLFWDFLGLGLAAHFMIARRTNTPGPSSMAEQMADSPLTPELATTETVR